MPQDIPIEASETLAFTPASLKGLGDDAPVFTLRSPTPRDKRYIRRLYLREGVRRHSQDDIRREVLAGLNALWDAEVAQRNGEMLQAYWSAQDDFALIKQDDPEAAFDYDKDLAAACRELPGKVSEFWPKLGEMLADNADFAELDDPIHVSVTVKGWTGLEHKPAIDEGYITLPCAEGLAAGLIAFEKRHELPLGLAWTELVLACWARVNLDEEEAKNFVSPSPSEMTPPASSQTTTSEDSDGKSPASARSKKTRQKG